MINAEAYAKSHDLQTHDANEIIEEFADEIGEMHGTCIDVGCGLGDVTVDLVIPRLARDAVVVGADISDTMLEIAKKVYADEKRLSFAKLDIETLNLPEKEIGRYDNMLSFYCLHWCQNMRQTFENVFKLLRPGGKALVVFIASNDGFDVYEEISKNPRYQPYMEDAYKFVPVFNNFTNPRASLKKVLEEAGFEVLHCSRREKTFVYKNFEVFEQHVFAVNPFVARIPENLVDDFKNDMLRHLKNQKIVFSKGNNEEHRILDRYYLLVAYFKKPVEK